jgi:serine/threonine-protein kinase
MTTENPYAAPAVEVADSVPDVPQTLKKIKNAWAAAVLSGCLSLLFALIAMLKANIFYFSVGMLINVALTLGLAFGIYKKSRTCALLMFTYLILLQINGIIETGRFTKIVFGYFFWQGISGTFAYHKLSKHKLYKAGDSVPDIPETLKKIKNAWVAVVFFGCLTLLAALIAMPGIKMLHFSAWSLIDVALMFCLAFGIYKRSRTCAVLMFIFFISAQINGIIETGELRALAIVFGYFFWQGIFGTFAYHKLNNRRL